MSASLAFVLTGTLLWLFGHSIASTNVDRKTKKITGNRDVVVVAGFVIIGAYGCFLAAIWAAVL